MHKTRTTFIGQVAKLVAEFLRHKVEAGRDTVAQTVSTQPENVAKVTKVTVKLLGLVAIVSITPMKGTQVQAEFVRSAPAATIRDWVSNFITEDGQYFLLADGKLLFVKEEE